MKLRHAYAALVALSVLAAFVPFNAARADWTDADASRGGAFELSGYGARAWGLGGAALAIVDDESAVYWNPAMMGFVTSRIAGASYLQLVEGTGARQSQVMYVHPFARDDRSQKERGISRHVIGGGYANIFLDINGPETYSENHFLASYAYTPEDFVTFAVTARAFFSRSGVDGFGAKGTSVTGAARLEVIDGTTIALVLRDLFSRYSYDDGLDQEVEQDNVLAIATNSIPWVSIEADAALAHSDFVRTAFGIETEYIYGYLALRAGYSTTRSGMERSVPSFGLSLRGLSRRLHVHYAATIDDETALGTTHRFSVGYVLP